MSDMCKCGHGVEVHVGVRGCYSFGCLCTFFETNKSLHELYDENKRLRTSTKILKGIDESKSVEIPTLRAENDRLVQEIDKMIAWHEGDDCPHARLDNEISRLQVVVNEAEKAIKIALKTLPDSEHEDDSWDFAWEELSGDAQDFVKDTRLILFTWLKENGGRE